MPRHSSNLAHAALLVAAWAWSSLEANAFVCSLEMLKNAPANLPEGSECGGACNSAGTCAPGLVCEQPKIGQGLEGFGALHSMMGFTPTGKCIKDHQKTEEDAVAVAAVEQLNQRVNSIYMYVPVRVYGLTSSTHGQDTRYHATIEVATSTCMNDGKHSVHDSDCQPSGKGTVQAFDVTVVKHNPSPSWMLEDFSPVPTHARNTLTM